MRHDELVKTITTSAPDHWVLLDTSGGIFLTELGEVSGGGQHWLETSTHHCLAVYKDDIDLRLAWGMTTDRDLSLEGWAFPDPKVDRVVVDAFWRGALVNRWTVLVVDGGRCYLPDPHRITVKTGAGPIDIETDGWEAPVSEIALARVVNDMTRSGGRDFDSYLQQAGIRENHGK